MYDSAPASKYFIGLKLLKVSTQINVVISFQYHKDQ